MMNVEQLSHWFLNILSLGGILFVGLFNIVIYYVRKLLRAYYYFGMICIFYFIWYVCSVIDVDLFLLQELSDHHKQIIAVLSTNRMSLFFILYMMRILDIRKPVYEKRMKLGSNVLLALGVFMPLSIVYANILIWAIQLFNMAAQLYLGYAAFRKIKLLYQNKDIRLINAVAYLIVCITGVLELTDIQFQPDTIYLAFVLIVSQAIILAIHYNTALVEVEQANATLEQKVVERTADLVRKEEETIHLVSSISHDLRTPISVVSGYMELLQSDPNIQSTHKTYITKSLVRLLQMEKLTIDLITLSQLSDKSYTFHLEPVNMVNTAKQAAELYMEQAKQKSITLSMDMASEAWCNADKIRLMQVLDNLLMNALAYARSSIMITVLVTEDEVKVTVSDDGSGIHSDDLPHVFDRYYKRRKRGSGIGLSNVKELVHLMHGEVAVESVPEARTSFMFALPRLSDR